MRISHVMFLLLIVLFGCHSNIKKDTSPIIDTDWATLSITSEDQVQIIINKDEDTSLVINRDVGSFFTGFHKAKIDTLKTCFTIAEKDSLFHLSDEIISVPVRPKAACTDFVGDLNITIYYGSYKSPRSYSRSVGYSGICSWDTLSGKTMALHEILQRRIKWWHK
jgi:hypothetical protein